MTRTFRDGSHRHCSPHSVERAYRRGWATLANGELIAAAEAAGFDVLVTADQNLEHQQNSSNRRMSIVVLNTNRRPIIEPRIARIRAALDEASSGSFLSVACF